ncbi:MAG: hypothetical protein ABL921_00740 [Pirellula sp.]
MKKSKIALGLALSFSAMAPYSMAQEAVATPVGVPAASIPKMGPITVTVDLLGGQTIHGTLTEVTMLPIKTAFGEASVPLVEVAGVRLASAEENSTTVIMKNGDSITGATDLKVISVDTEWGSAKINGSSVKSILLLPDLKWNATIGLNGKRWSLVDAKAAPPTGNIGNIIQGQPGQPGTVVNRPGTTTTSGLPSGARIIPN